MKERKTHHRIHSWQMEKYMFIAMIMFILGVLTGNVEEPTWVRWGKIIGPWIRPLIYTAYVIIIALILWVVKMNHDDKKREQQQNDQTNEVN